MTDENLMQAVANGNLDQAAVLYERYKRLMFSYFWKHGLDRENCQDLTHQVFVRVLTYRLSYKTDAMFKPWIYRIAHNIYVDHLKENPFQRYDIEEIKDVIADESKCHDSEDERLIKKALLMIPTEFREVLMLSKYEELKYEQIAETLNISLALVKVRVHRGIKSLKEAYLTLV